MREIAIGDIHGCYEDLLGLLGTIGRIKPADKIIFIGDGGDRGPDSAKVFKLLKEFKENHKANIVYGNHDDMMLDYFGFPSAYKYDEGLWLFGNGGEETLESFEKEKMDAKEMATWLLNSIKFSVETKNAVYVHGGIYPNKKTAPYDMIWMREEVLYQKQPKLLVVGHTVVPKAPEIHKDLRIIRIDNGCVYGWGPLLGFDVINKVAYYSNGDIKDLANEF